MARRSSARARRGGAQIIPRGRRTVTPTSARLARMGIPPSVVPRAQIVGGFPEARGQMMLGSPGLGQIIDITPGIPARDLQVIDRRNVLVDVNTGRVMKAVSITAKLQKRHRPRARAARADPFKQIQPLLMLKLLDHGGCR